MSEVTPEVVIEDVRKRFPRATYVTLWQRHSWQAMYGFQGSVELVVSDPPLWSRTFSAPSLPALLEKIQEVKDA